MVSYRAVQPVTGVLELENRQTGDRLVGSNPTPSANVFPIYNSGWAAILQPA